MGRGRGLKGHKRILERFGIQTSRQRPYSGGYRSSCICGWSGGLCGRSEKSLKEYSFHVSYTIDNGSFKCRRCGKSKGAKEMRPDYRYMCLDCFSKSGNEWASKNPTRSARHKRNHHLIKNFGITLVESELLLKKQGGVCAICRKEPREKRGLRPHLDHDHATGKVRGILCAPCNFGLGAFRDNTINLKSAIRYLNAARDMNV